MKKFLMKVSNERNKVTRNLKSGRSELNVEKFTRYEGEQVDVGPPTTQAIILTLALNETSSGIMSSEATPALAIDLGTRFLDYQFSRWELKRNGEAKCLETNRKFNNSGFLNTNSSFWAKKWRSPIIFSSIEFQAQKCRKCASPLEIGYFPVISSAVPSLGVQIDKFMFLVEFVWAARIVCVGLICPGVRETDKDMPN